MMLLYGSQIRDTMTLDKVLDIIEKMGLKIKAKKCLFSISTLTFASHKISADPKKTDTVQKK